MQPTDPIIVRVVQEPVKSTTIVDVLVGSLGLVGALLLAALVLGALLGGDAHRHQDVPRPLQPGARSRLRVAPHHAAVGRSSGPQFSRDAIVAFDFSDF